MSFGDYLDTKLYFKQRICPRVISWCQTAAALYAKAAGQNAQARQLYNSSADTYYKANDAAAYDDWVRTRNHWDYFYNCSYMLR